MENRYCLIKDCIVTQYENKIAKIISESETRFEVQPINESIILHVYKSDIEVIDKLYTIEDASKLNTDISVLQLPRRIWCDSNETISAICRKLSQCHIGTCVNSKLMFIQT